MDYIEQKRSNVYLSDVNCIIASNDASRFFNSMFSNLRKKYKRQTYYHLYIMVVPAVLYCPSEKHWGLQGANQVDMQIPYINKYKKYNKEKDTCIWVQEESASDEAIDVVNTIGYLHQVVIMYCDSTPLVIDWNIKMCDNMPKNTHLYIESKHLVCQSMIP